MDQDFLKGIDEHFEQLMKLESGGNGRRNGGHRNGTSRDSVVAAILDELEGLSPERREEVLTYVRSLTHESDRP